MPESTLQPDRSVAEPEESAPVRPGPPHSVLTAVVATDRASSRAVLPRAVFDEQLADAERLIRHAADTGIEIDDEVRRQVLEARLATADGWSEEHAANLLSALTKLSMRLKPVSAESLRKCVVDKEAAQTIRSYRRVAVMLGIIIVPFSVAAFVATASCEAVRKDIEVANALAVTLVRAFGLAAGAGPRGSGSQEEAAAHGGDAMSDLQQFAATNRAIYARARTLDSFAVFAVADPWSTNKNGNALPVFEVAFGTSTLAQEAQAKIKLYQDVRHFAQSVREAVSTTFGAATSCILPMLYALLGACAWLIRTFEDQIKARTFTGTDKATARFLIAAIGGLVVGLFGNFGTGHGASLPPLAVAFLVGYAVDVFFFFLDRLLQTFGTTQVKAAAPPT